MGKPLRNLVMLMLWFSVFSIGTWAETSVWKAEKDDSIVYLGGTIHLLRSSDLPLPDEFAEAYAASNRLFFETDMDVINSPAAQIKLLSLMTAEPEGSLKNILSDQAYRALSSALIQRGLNIQMLEPFKVSMAVLTLQVAEFSRLGVDQEGVDTFYFKQAKQDRIPTGHLESVDHHFNYVASMGDGWEEDLVQLTLRDLDKTAELFDVMLLAWRSGDLRQLEDLFVAEMRNDYPDAYQDLLVERNQSWLPQIEKMFVEPGTEFVLVGAGHMVGQEGLLHQLAMLGYRITQL